MSSDRKANSARQPNPSSLATDLQSTSKLVIDAVVGITDIVESMHRTIAAGTLPLGKARSGPTTGIAGFVYRRVRGITRGVGVALDAGLGRLAPLLDRKVLPPVERAAALSALNGVLGDYLMATGNPLAIPMQWRRDGAVVEPRDVFAAGEFTAKTRSSEVAPTQSRKLLVLLHGLCMNDGQWLRAGHDHGAALSAELGYTPLYLRYNSGLSVSANGQQLASMLEALIDSSEASPVDITLLGHSMGGLLARSALHYGQAEKHRWVTQCSTLICLGTPHLGAPLERAGHTLDRLLGISPYSAPFARLGLRRSVGIQDLHNGRITEDVAASSLPGNVQMYMIAASKQPADKAPGRRLPGDGLVPVNSALGRHDDPTYSLNVPESRRALVYGHDHFDLLSSREVYSQLVRWLSPSA